MIPDQIKSYLDRTGIPFRTATHPYGVTAQRTAEMAHVSGKTFGKAVVLRQGEQYVLAIVPADERIDLSAIRDLIGPGVDLASEAEMSRLFPGCEEGAMPPLGGLYGLPVVADACLAQQEKITINGGTHTDVIELRWEDFERVEHPRMLTH